jgi:hypothetical protein
MWNLVSHIEEHRLRMFENRVLRKKFRPKMDEEIWEWRRLHNEELHDLYSSHITPVIKSRSKRWMGHVESLREGSGAYRGLVKKSEEKRPLGRPGRRWEDNIEKYLQEAG